VIAFGGRTLRKDVPAKYVNSPESIIYKKSNELYGLYQARSAISRKDKCILVEGYMDVISMSQSGIENVVASSGTSLTEGQIRLIRRFTSNVTVIYDGDAAGIKASMRGIGMLLAEGLDIKVLLLPDGHDPDSFAQSRSSSQLEEYIDTNEEDFIGFMTRILMRDAKDNPIDRARAVTEVVKTIALIPNPVTRNLYIVECSRQLLIDEGVVRLEVEKYFIENAERQRISDERKKNLETLPTDDTTDQSATEVNEHIARQLDHNATAAGDAFMLPYEKLLLQLVLRYGMLDICEDVDENGNTYSVKVVDFVDNELRQDQIAFTDPGVRAAFDETLRLLHTDWPADYERNEASLLAERENTIVRGREEVMRNAHSVDDIQRLEKQLIDEADRQLDEARMQFAITYIERAVCSSPDDTIRRLGLELVPETHILSKYHTKYAHIPTDAERVADLVPRAIYELKDAVLV
ncbi:MAG: toprim domain-containing protein, partial [Muribaculum sp.]|nr:toprim domain-containing protein [Muribaculum sp.]